MHKSMQHSDGSGVWTLVGACAVEQHRQGRAVGQYSTVMSSTTQHSKVLARRTYSGQNADKQGPSPQHADGTQPHKPNKRCAAPATP